MIGNKFRINFLSCYAVSGSGIYKVVTQCYLLDSARQRILPSGTVFSGSSNIYTNGPYTFEAAYRGTNVWHSEALASITTPFWGTVEFPEPQDVAGIYWKTTGAFADGRSPKDWSIERWDEDTGQWGQVRRIPNETPWANGEIRDYPLNTVAGRVIELIGQAAPRLVLFDWSEPTRFQSATVQSDGHWENALPVFPGDQYGIYYLSQDNRCPPIIHGPYTAE